MIRIEDRELPTATAQTLEAWQAALDAMPDYAVRVERADSLFHSRNKADNAVFSVVRSTLDAMCQGARRCGYCEDSAADEVEHIRPKSLYPESAFQWANYLYACGPCNNGKNNHYAVFDGDAVHSVARGPKEPPVVPPREGDPVFIDPRREDPLAYILLDLVDTFKFVPLADKGTREYERGVYTIEKLRLDRDVLTRARRGAFKAYLRRLEAYVSAQRAGEGRTELEARRREILEADHRTVWREMQRQVQLFPDKHAQLVERFMDAPEALRW